MSGELMEAVYRAEKLDACLKCSACTAECPVARVNTLFPGPKAAGPDAERLRLEGIYFDPLVLAACSNCKTCEITCPSSVNITDLIMEARRKGFISGTKKKSLRYRLRALVLGRAEYLGMLGTVYAPVTNFVLKKKIVRVLMEKSLGIGRNAPLPEYHRKFAMKSKIGLNPKRVIYFPGCYSTYNDALTAKAVVKVLEHNGFSVLTPRFRCCGVPLQSNDQFSQAEANALHNLRLFAPYLEQGIPVIASCPSCTLSLKQEYPKYSSPGAKMITAKTYDLFEFLWNLYLKGQLRQDFRPSANIVGYHVPCHLKAQGIGTPVVRLLHLISGFKVKDLDSGCCGLSGSYSFKEENYAAGMQIGKPLFDKVKSGVQTSDFKEIITECGTCNIQIAHGTGVQVRHPIWYFLEGYGLS
ncbi:anaerobic glycerol-3-phosphate dehydrogenase subunit C [Desulfosporosinus youngiae]|uniref:Glycerol-3-phosphate dehydrogenase, anaerobic, C subunit n=1 Tax=Desulfosporosinus youngiae DSM 17734 TaxID=768710 RepID=H5Y0E9_9FIRM|nr:anaerobic glycerol-3-phosphate dehydrogenase subunit C [Desulfosporosinus youngiae]EHQ92205.1 glycerol-3-phosphate dehydrogenase, anaerobic, C subunit [Desulfosporosinus youngiae DSM 17734]